MPVGRGAQLRGDERGRQLLRATLQRGLQPLALGPQVGPRHLADLAQSGVGPEGLAVAGQLGDACLGLPALPVQALALARRLQTPFLEPGALALDGLEPLADGDQAAGDARLLGLPARRRRLSGLPGAEQTGRPQPAALVVERPQQPGCIRDLRLQPFELARRLLGLPPRGLRPVTVAAGLATEAPLLLASGSRQLQEAQAERGAGPLGRQAPRLRVALALGELRLQLLLPELQRSLLRYRFRQSPVLGLPLVPLLAPRGRPQLLAGRLPAMDGDQIGRLQRQRLQVAALLLRLVRLLVEPAALLLGLGGLRHGQLQRALELAAQPRRLSQQLAQPLLQPLLPGHVVPVGPERGQRPLDQLQLAALLRQAAQLGGVRPDLALDRVQRLARRHHAGHEVHELVGGPELHEAGGGLAFARVHLKLVADDLRVQALPAEVARPHAVLVCGHQLQLRVRT